jgi:hypothetical protein
MQEDPATSSMTKPEESLIVAVYWLSAGVVWVGGLITPRT